MSIYTNRGIDVPPLSPVQEMIKAPLPTSVSLSISSFFPAGFLPMVEEGDTVLIGMPILRHISLKELRIVSPVSGHVHKIFTPNGCRPERIELFLSEKQESFDFDPFPEELNPISIVQNMANRGLLACVRSLPYDVMPDPSRLPRSIFVRALESSPGVIPTSCWISSYWSDFTFGLRLLSRICPNNLHVVHGENDIFSTQDKLEGVHYHSLSGPHPIGNGAVQVHLIDPVRSPEDVIWVISVRDVVSLAKHGLEGRYWPDTFFSISSSETNFESILVKGIIGTSVKVLLESLKDRYNRVDDRLISGDIFSGEEISRNQFIRLQDSSLILLGDANKFPPFKISGSYFNRFQFSYCTNGFPKNNIFPLDHSLYERVLPMDIPVAHLLRACWSGDWKEAIRCGLLELSTEEAALFSSVCPAHFDFISLFRTALRICYTDYVLSR
ncbi:hypothetical protein [Candidatus Similichlamydia epinepheli]|uniref:hypothetical protein n=1 Tax=Candidatus Similichlamydia epinepheli TaxID=1903953 RepID=UPI001300918A|nr:hypothetical protein [Candidatus Similichlamydia epinepheli]